MSDDQLLDVQAQYIAETYGVSIEAARDITRALEKRVSKKARRRR